MQNRFTNFLLSRHYVPSTGIENPNKVNVGYLSAYLLVNFGIQVDKPEYLTAEHVKQIADFMHLRVPDSFYKNPQDTKYFTSHELLVEQIVSYWAGYGTNIGRIELFAKDLPEYAVGDELKLRTFYIINKEEIDKVATDAVTSFCAYTRPFSTDELNEFMMLRELGYYHDTELACKDNIFTLLEFDVSFARFLDKKDIVKLSVQYFGEQKSFDELKSSKSSYRDKQFEKSLATIASYIPYVKNCPLSKKQAKYFNKICKLCGIAHKKETNKFSPDKKAMALLKAGDVIGAAEVYAKSGSMLERRIKMLLSRANPVEAVKILEMLPAKNPLVLYQTINNIVADNGEARIFTFFANNRVKKHVETEYETTWRKSKLNESTRKLLHDVSIEKIYEYYRSKESVGKVYIADNFSKIALPVNTSASGKGLDVLPTGSRIPCTTSNVRTFVHWKDAFDIDSSLILVHDSGRVDVEGWFSYSRKSFGNDVLFSGDITGRNGAEYFDIKLDALKAKGYKYVVQTFHGYCSTLDSGEIYAGYQNKDNFETEAWDPKNIEMQFHVKGASRACVAFGIDLETMEVVLLNQILDDDSRVVNAEGFKVIQKFFDKDFLEINIGNVVANFGELTDNIEEANLVLDDTYVSTENAVENQTVIRSWETEKLVALINK